MSARSVTTAGLLASHRPLWRVVCRNPFIVGVRDGSLPVETFNRWLVQDRHFVDGLFSAVSRILAAAPEKDRGLLLHGLRDLQDNLVWFDQTLRERRLDPHVPVHPVNRAYIDYMVSLGFESYPVALVATWAQYRAYRDAWAAGHRCAPRFRKVVHTWYSTGYERFMRQLARATDAALAQASSAERDRAAAAFVQVAQYELAFWVMTMEEKAHPA